MWPDRESKQEVFWQRGQRKANNLWKSFGICVYQEGAFEVIDCHHIATLQRGRAKRRQAT
jgi:hypothetical protein